VTGASQWIGADRPIEPVVRRRHRKQEGGTIDLYLYGVAGSEISHARFEFDHKFLATAINAPIHHSPQIAAVLPFTNYHLICTYNSPKSRFVELDDHPPARLAAASILNQLKNTCATLRDMIVQRWASREALTLQKQTAKQDKTVIRFLQTGHLSIGDCADERLTRPAE
jgi:hypothetical protein